MPYIAWVGVWCARVAGYWPGMAPDVSTRNEPNNRSRAMCETNPIKPNRTQGQPRFQIRIEDLLGWKKQNEANPICATATSADAGWGKRCCYPQRRSVAGGRIEELVEEVDMAFLLGDELVLDKGLAGRVKLIDRIAIIFQAVLFAFLKALERSVVAEEVHGSLNGLGPCAPRARGRRRLG